MFQQVPVPLSIYYRFALDLKRLSALKVVTNEKGEAVGEVLTIIC